MAATAIACVCDTLTRKKMLDADVLETPLRRCLNLFDLLLLGVGHMVGAGIFVITGTVVKDVAGPSVVISYLLAGVAAMLSALCYAEFGARVPKAGSAYTYTYVTIGEFFAFIIGWNMILECLIGTASVARAWSGSFDALFNGAIRNGTIEHLGAMNAPWLSDYPDFIAVLIVVVLAVFISAGAKISTNFNSALTVVNMVILILIMVLGFYLADIKNWTNPLTRGFTPFGFKGVIAGAGSCFYAYIGFEGIATAGEEATDPSRAIPVATGIAVGIVSLLYVGCSAALTLMVSWKDVVVAAPYPSAFDEHGMTWAKYVVAIGSLVGISTSLLGSLFALPRSVYSMAADGLFFKSFATVNPRTQTPILSIVVFGLITALMALLFDLEFLVELLSIGTLLSFTIVAACIIVLHYQPVDRCQFQLKPDQSTLLQQYDDNVSDKTSMESIADDRERIMKTSQSHEDIGRLKNECLSFPLLRRLAPGQASIIAVVSMTVFMVAFWLLVLRGTEHLAEAKWWSILLIIIFAAGIILSFSILVAHERNTSFLTFQVPLAPFVPALSMMFNIGMMIQLNGHTWIRLAIWIVIGLFIYFGYGIWHSTERKGLLNADNQHIPSYSSSATVTQPTVATSAADGSVQQASVSES